MNKKNAFRFTVQLNCADSRHLQAAELLNSRGRHKAQFIVNAILHYVNCGETPIESTVGSTLDYSTIEAIVNKILQSKSIANAGIKAPEHDSDTDGQPAKRMAKSDVIDFGELEQEIGADALSAIADSVNAFRVKSP